MTIFQYHYLEKQTTMHNAMALYIIKFTLGKIKFITPAQKVLIYSSLLHVHKTAEKYFSKTPPPLPDGNSLEDPP